MHLLCAALFALPPIDAGVDHFESKIRPILVDKCQRCHGAKKQEGGLRLDSRAAFLKGGESGPAFDSKTPLASRMLAAVRRDGDLKMPPDEPLSKPEVAAVESWLSAGAPWPDEKPVGVRSSAAHWAFQPVRRPSSPPVLTAAWVHTPVDSFILAKLEAAKLTPTREADRPTLVRRASLTLTGLLPTAAEVDAFVADAKPDAYERLVDRLLASPAYGEHWGRRWLDLARYSDTKGYVYGREEPSAPTAWTYRDWVVKALNDDLPYDRFVRIQIAADLLPGAAPADQAALGFLTVGKRFIGVSHDIIDDRIDVTSRTFLGMTVGCARCHDHKFDPIPTQDYYSLYGVFRGSFDRLTRLGPPTSDKAFEAGLAERQKKLAARMTAARAEASARHRSRTPEYLLAQLERGKFAEEGFDQVFEKSDLLPGVVRRWTARIRRAAARPDPVFGAWAAYEALPASEFRAKAPGVPGSLPVKPNPLVAALLAKPPASMREVAERYGRLLMDVEKQWAAAKKGTASLADPAAEQIRREIHAADAPCIVPDEPIAAVDQLFDTATLTELHKLAGDVERWLRASRKPYPFATSLVERPPQDQPRVFKRGNPGRMGDETPLHFLSALGGRAFKQGNGRRELAEAIADPRNPLTARVMVNRVWQGHFGAGLVRTPSDFGARAEPPTHPELLDWLAAEFVADGWSMKKLHRMLLLSATFRQDSRGVDPRSMQRDPENRLLSRMPVRRLTWEEQRDRLLAAGGDLDRTVGGLPVEAFSAPFARRRALYAYIDRQFLPGALRTFDFANPDLHIPARSDTATAPQALYFLNDPFLADRAKALALRATAKPPRERIRQMYLAALQRPPTSSEAEQATSLVAAAESEPAPTIDPRTFTWSYGFGSLDLNSERVTGFTPLPHFTGSAWQGGPQWPDAKLGWAQLTATGGHAGDDAQHAVVRRWAAPASGRFAVDSALKHEHPEGDGVRAWIVSSRHGILAAAAVHHREAPLTVPAIALNAGDTLDFVVDRRANLNNDDFRWAAKIRKTGKGTAARWDSAEQFHGPQQVLLSPWEQLAQVLLESNEFVFVD